MQNKFAFDILFRYDLVTDLTNRYFSLLLLKAACLITGRFLFGLIECTFLKGGVYASIGIGGHGIGLGCVWWC